MMYDLSKCEVVETGNWQNPPPITLIDDLNGFFKMFDSVSDMKLLKWQISSDIPHRTIQVQKGNYIGFFAHGKLFSHFMREFESIEDYMEAFSRNIRTPKELDFDREARKKHWPAYKKAKEVWGYIRGRQLSEIGILEKKRRELFKNIGESKTNEPHYDLMPPYSSDCHDAKDWLFWFYANLNGWKSYKEVISFAKEVFPDYDEIIKDDHWRYIYITYIVFYGPFDEKKDWLQGWPGFNSILNFWNMKRSSIYINRLIKSISRIHRNNMLDIQKKFTNAFKFPSLTKFDSDCKNQFDWIIWKTAQENDWLSYKQLLTVRDSKDPKINSTISDKILYEFAIRTPSEVKEINIKYEHAKNRLFFTIKDREVEI